MSQQSPLSTVATPRARLSSVWRHGVKACEGLVGIPCQQGPPAPPIDEGVPYAPLFDVCGDAGRWPPLKLFVRAPLPLPFGREGGRDAVKESAPGGEEGRLWLLRRLFFSARLIFEKYTDRDATKDRAGEGAMNLEGPQQSLAGFASARALCLSC